MLSLSKRWYWLLLGLLGLLWIGRAAVAATPMVSLGYQHSVALRSDGTVVAWGSDQAGQIGTGRENFETRPGAVTGLGTVHGIGAGVTHALAVLADGSVWAWGSNESGQVGEPPGTDRPSPVRVNGISNATEVCGGDAFSVALKTDGTVWAWGSNYRGALGNGTRDDSSSPVQVSGLDGVASVACGLSHVVALRLDGTVWAWGSNDEGELGDGSTTMRLKAVQVTGLSNVRMVTAGQYFGAALKVDGTVWEWGVRDGYASPHGAPRMVPVQATGVAGAVAIAATLNSFWLLAIQADHKTWWNWQTSTPPEMKAPVGNLQSVVAGYGQFFFVTAEGIVLAGGGGGFGSLGDGTTNYRDAPEPVADITNIVQVASGGWFGLALDSSGRVWSWGLDASGQLGRGRILGRSTPQVVAGLSRIETLAAGHHHNLAVDLDGSVWAWGDNGYGQLGDASYQNKSTPIRLDAINNVQAVAAGAYYSLALKRDGTVWQWVGMLDGQFEQPAIPNRMLDGVVAMAAGPVHSLALKADGSVWAWGVNNAGQLGDGSKINRARPVQVAGLADIRMISASQTSSYAVKADGTVVAWGDNTRGQLGDGTTTERLSPVAAVGLDGVAEIAAGLSHVLVRKSDGSVWGWSWDYETSGELGAGLGSGAPSLAAQLTRVEGIVQLAAGAQVSALVRSSGQVLLGGKNYIGQLGDGTFSTHPSLVLAVNPQLDGFLQLQSGGAATAPGELQVPFFVSATGGIVNTSATVTTSTQFNAVDMGVAGSVFVTARVPVATLGTVLNASERRRALLQPSTTSTNATVLVQLTGSGWQAVINGQLIPYVSGVFGGQLATQSILSNTNTSQIKGAEFCVGYGLTAQEMIATGRIRTVATIPGTADPSLPAGLNCLGNTTTSPNDLNRLQLNCLFDAAEDRFPSLLAPRRPLTQTIGPYSYRYYATQRSYIAYSSSDAHLLFVDGPATPLDLGLAAPLALGVGCR